MNRLFYTVPLAALAWLALPASSSARAQDFERIAPHLPPGGGDGAILEDQPEELSPSDDHTELLPALKGLVLVPTPGDVRVAGRPEVSGVRVEGVPLLDQAEWATRLAPRLGAPLRMSDLHAIMREIILHYRSEDRPVVDVLVLEQDITSGVVQLAVVEARLGEVRAEGAKHFKAERLAGQIRLTPGQPIYSTLLRADLAWLNNNPFRSVDLVYTPGRADGETDVVLRVEDRFPLRLYTGYEDSGNQLTGEDRWLAGINYGNLWGLDHQINYQWSFGSEIDQLSAHAVSYIAPLPWRHTATLFAAHVASEADLPAPFNLSGETWQIGGRYTVPLPGGTTGSGGHFSHELELGFDFKNSTSNLAFGLLPLPGVDTDIGQFLIGYRVRLQDSLGATGLGIFGYASPGGMSQANETPAFQTARAGAEAAYHYARLDVERLQRLPGGWTAALKGVFQAADENLLPSEQLGLGGYSSVRGYEEREANVDRGYFLSAELRTPPVSLLQTLNLSGGGDELQFLVFVDHASGGSVHRLPGEARQVTLTSVGPGLRWTMGDQFSMRLDYGFQLEDTGMALSQGDSRIHLGMVLAY